MQTQSHHSSADVIHAKTRDGLALAVIDLTHPDFAVHDDAKSIEALQGVYVAWHAERQRMPKFVTRFMLMLAATRSPLFRALFQSQGYLDSITTYIMKLGERHLPPGYDGPLDRKMAAAPHVPLIRLRMQQIATFCAEALAEPLRKNPRAPLHLVNIAGGPALDSANTLIFLKRDHGDLLRRPIRIHVLDARQEGPDFGANALAALTADGAPLAGLDATFSYHPYDWTQTAPLRELLADLAAHGAIIAATSEGGLFEYGDDDAIVANLAALHAAGVGIVAGSVTSSSELRRQMIAETKFKLHPRGLEGFAPLALRAGYDIAQSAPAFLSDQVLLRPLAPRRS